jgi:hypothetical protein
VTPPGCFSVLTKPFASEYITLRLTLEWILTSLDGGAYMESSEAMWPDSLTPPRITAVQQIETPRYTLRVTDPLVLAAEYRHALQSGR